MALQNSILKWSSDHRRHHGNLDDLDKDPYCAKRGFWFSHIAWMLRYYPSAWVDYSNVKDLQQDWVVRFQERVHLLLAIGTNLLIPVILGLIYGNVVEMVLVAGFFCLVIGHHTTFFINSLAHIWGTQPSATDNTSRDIGILAVFTFGEGYHNFHHAFPGDYRNGIKVWQWDPSKWFIRLLWSIGLVANLRITPTERITARRS